MVGSRAAGLRVSGSTLSPANKSNEFWGSFCTCLFQQEWCAPGMEQQVWQRMGRGTRARVGGGAEPGLLQLWRTQLLCQPLSCRKAGQTDEGLAGTGGLFSPASPGHAHVRALVH